MDLSLFFSVLWRYRSTVIAGTLVTVVLTVLATFNVTFKDGPGLEHRKSEIWTSASQLLLTQDGFPWGRSTLNDVVPVDKDGKDEYAPRFADMGRYQGLAVLYARFAGSDEVRREVRRSGPIRGEYGAEVIRADDGNSFLPMIAIKAYGDTREEATALAERVTTAFRTYLGKNQVSGAIPADERVKVEVINAPEVEEAELFQGRSFTPSMVVFLLGMGLTLGIAFLRENLRKSRELGAETRSLLNSASRSADVPKAPNGDVPTARRGAAEQWFSR